MPKAKKLTRSELLVAAAEVVRKRGEGALNARAVAAELGCSTQPVYSLFGSMEELKSALLGEATARYRRFIEDYLSKGDRSRYEAYGMGFVKFAREERGLFRFLFLREGRNLEDPFFGDILHEMETLYRMPREKAREFHADMGVFSFGLAALVYQGAELSEEEISEAYKREFYALYCVHFPERPRFWERA